ncbi:STAS domain-containing protein [Streptomyces sp. NPDC052494]|uniref:STAS domain-containing protein n=1 Tax=Streptomyces sp. NPDC052494 TaxID=3365692 RepID=UPI0037CFBE94
MPSLHATPDSAAVHDSGADAAPGDIVIASCTTLGTTLVLHLAGEIDHYSAAPLRALLASAADIGCTGLVLDTARVAFCDSGFLAVLDQWPRHGRRFRLVNPSRPVQRLLNAAAAARQQQPGACTPRSAATS